MKGWDDKAIERNLTGKPESERSVTVSAGERRDAAPPKAMKRQQISLGIMRRDVIGEIWLKAGVFEYVEDLGTHLRAYHKENKRFYIITVTEEIID